MNWYWALGDGATLVRDAAVDGFGAPSKTSEQDVAGVRLLDRFLVPPVTSKDSYYNVNLVHVLWRAAYESIQHATRLTVIGYSMPPADRIAAELIRSLPGGTPVDLVNWNVGSEDEPLSPLGRARSLGLNVVSNFEGTDAVPAFASHLMDEASVALESNDALREAASASIVVAIRPPGTQSRPGSFTLKSATNSDHAGVVDLDWMKAGRSDMPPNEVSLNSLAPGSASLADFYNGARLHGAITEGRPFTFHHNERSYRMIGARNAKLDRWSILLGLHAPE